MRVSNANFLHTASGELIRRAANAGKLLWRTTSDSNLLHATSSDKR